MAWHLIIEGGEIWRDSLDVTSISIEKKKKLVLYNKIDLRKSKQTSYLVTAKFRGQFNYHI